MRIAFFGVLLALFSLAVLAQDKNAAPGIDEMMKKMEPAAAPGPAHEKLAMYVGSWNVKTSVWLAGPDQPPTVTNGTAEFTSILGGRFVMEQYQSEVMGKTMHGMGINGYDNDRKKYTLFWIDDMGTVMSTADGNFDKSGKVLTCYGKGDDPTTGEYDKNLAYITRIVDNDKFTFEIDDLSIGGSDMKTMILEYTRKK